MRPVPRIDINSEVFWIDQLGDILEAQGVPPGCIFEFHENLNPEDLEDGGVIVTHLPEGELPRSPLDVAEVYIRRHPNGMGEVLIQMDGKRPLFMSGFRHLEFM